MFREDLELAIRQQTETEKRDRVEDLSLSLSDLSVSSRPTSVLRADPELPFLEMAWSPSHMQEFLNRHVLPAVWPDQQLAALAIDEMHYKPGKQCEITYSLQCAASTSGQARSAGATF